MFLHADNKAFGADEEFLELTAAYQPVLWTPDKRESMELAWLMHVDALGTPNQEKTEEEAKAAHAKWNGAAVLVCEPQNILHVHELLHELLHEHLGGSMFTGTL